MYYGATPCQMSGADPVPGCAGWQERLCTHSRPTGRGSGAPPHERKGVRGAASPPGRAGAEAGQCLTSRAWAPHGRCRFRGARQPRVWGASARHRSRTLSGHDCPKHAATCSRRMRPLLEAVALGFEVAARLSGRQPRFADRRARVRSRTAADRAPRRGGQSRDVAGLEPRCRSSSGMADVNYLKWEGPSGPELASSNLPPMRGCPSNGYPMNHSS